MMQARKGPFKWYISSEDGVPHLKAREEESCWPRKLVYGAAADKSNGPGASSLGKVSPGELYSSKKSNIKMNAESSRGPGASSPGKFSLESKATRKRKHSSSLSNGEPKYSPAGLAHKKKYAELRKRRKERMSERRKSLMKPSIPGSQRPYEGSFSQEPLLIFRETHTEALHRVIREAGPALRKQQQQAWSTGELDSLWIGVRRHGLGNWEAMLQDPRLVFSRFKTAGELEARWYLQELKSAFPCLNGQ